MNQEDIFKDKLNALFNDFEAPVPDDGWEKLEQSLNTSARIKIIRRNWYIGSAAAVAALLISGILFLNSPKPINLSEEASLARTEDISETTDTGKSSIEDLSEETLPNALPSADSPNLSKQDVKKKSNRGNSILLVSNKSRDDINNEDLFISKKMTDLEAEKASVSQTEINNNINDDLQLSQEEIDRLIQEFADAGNINIFGSDDSYYKKEQPIMLALNGKGALSGSQKVANNPMTLRSATVDDGGDENLYGSFSKNNITLLNENSTIITNSIADNIAKLDHLQPVSVGITISKILIDRLAVETGIVYTYLQSRAKNSSLSYSNQETQSFHYLGIPLNLNYYFASIGNLDLFVTVGGMIEKDIYGEYKSKGEVTSGDLSGSSEAMIKRKIKQENPQISVNAGFGLSYPLYKDLSLYGKVGGAYYFDAKNHQYKTIYADKQINLDLSAGIRFDF